MRLLLSNTALEALRRPVPGHGEIPDLFRSLQGEIIGNMLMVPKTDWEQLRRIAETGPPEFRERARALLEGAVPG